MENTLTYAQAMQRLEQIVEELESGEPDVDRMLAQVEEADGLVRLCRARLRTVSDNLDEVLARMKGE